MKKVEMSAAGLAVLLERSECFLRLNDILMHPDATPTQMVNDLETACREARDRLGMPARVPRPSGHHLVGEEVSASVAVTMLDQQEGKDTIFAKGSRRVIPMPAQLAYGYGKPQPQQSPVADALTEKRREVKAVVEAAMALEDRFPAGPLPPAEEAEVKALLVRADVLETEIDILDSRLGRRTHCVFNFNDDHPQVKDAYVSLYGPERAETMYRLHRVEPRY